MDRVGEEPQKGENLKGKRSKSNMSEEQREKIRMRHRLRRLNLTDEQKEIMHQKARERYKNLSKEVRDYRNAQKRMRRKALSGSEREEKLEKIREYKRNLSQERRERISIQRKQYKQSLNEQQREAMRMRARGYHHNQSEEQREKRRIRAKGYYLKLKQSKLEQPTDEINPLIKFIEALSAKTETETADAAIEAFDEQTYLQILKRINKKYAQGFYVRFLIEILKNWYSSNVIHNGDCDNLLKHATIHLKKVHKHVVEDVLELTCSAKQLRSWFAFTECESTSVPAYIYNWPHISMRINLPGFSMNRTISSIDEYYICKATKPYRYRIDGQHYIKQHNNTVTIPSELILNFLNRLLESISNNGFIEPEKKIHLVVSINEFKYDLNLCGNTIQTHGEYFHLLNLHPYTRTIADVNCRSKNVHLCQYSIPRLAFSVDNIETIHRGDVNFNFDELLVNADELISFKCVSCDEDLDLTSWSALAEHFFEYHGHENDWNCVKCNELFNTDLLSRSRWKHVCV